MPIKPSSRLISLDVFRGIIIAGMILVTDPGTYSTVFPQLRHDEWMGATATDMIFPSFLFMVGFSIALSFTSRLNRGATKDNIARHILLRSLILFVLGLAVNGFPDYDWHMLRIPGILQRIAICYLCCGFLYLLINNFKKTGIAYLKRNIWKLAIIAFVLLAGYWLMLVLVTVAGMGAGHLDTYGNLPAYIDRYYLGINHMWAYGLTPGMGVTYDPEGILSTIPAIASTLIGVLTGEWWLHTRSAADKKALYLNISGIALIIIGLVLSHFLPINKRIWTSTFALFSSGVTMLLFAWLYAVIDLNGWRKWTTPFLVLGSNAILAFVISSVITSLSDIIHVHSQGKLLTLHKWGNHLCTLTSLSAITASLLYAILIVVINILILTPLYRKKVFVKI